MGWDYMHKERWESAKAIIDSNCTWENETTAYRVLKSAIVNLHEYYAAVEMIDKETNKRTVFAAVSLLNYANGTYFNFGKKDMSEDMGPNVHNCPENILNLLTDTANKYAIEWRGKCRDAIKARRAKAALKPGTIIRLTDNDHILRIVKGNIMVDINNGRTYRVIGWKTRPYEVVSA